MRITVLGAGLVGHAMVLDLAREGEHEVTAVDRDGPARRQLEHRWRQLVEVGATGSGGPLSPLAYQASAAPSPGNTSTCPIPPWPVCAMIRGHFPRPMRRRWRPHAKLAPRRPNPR